MPDFSSMLYLGLWHSAGTLEPWTQLTRGVPSAFEEPPEAARLARRLAALIGCESALLAPSTLHLFWDLPTLLGRRAAVVIESGTYAIGRWGAERCASGGTPVRTFAHHDPDALRRALRRCPAGRRPVVIADGLAPAEDDPAPLDAYAAEAARYGGRLVIDDTQALGILGAAPDARMPYGHGGGGSLRFHGANASHVLVIASLAKGFGVPLALLAGTRGEVKRFDASSETRVHCSPPSTVALRAAERALVVNRMEGERLRERVLRLVRLFHAGVERLGLRCSGGSFPVQALAPMQPALVSVVQAELRRHDVRAIAQRHDGSRARLCFVITARHSRVDVERALVALASARQLMVGARLAA
jgi:8-amino-7-oxononanoate synthase